MYSHWPKEMSLALFDMGSLYDVLCLVLFQYIFFENCSIIDIIKTKIAKTKPRNMKENLIFAMNKGKEAGLSKEVANKDFHQDGVELPGSNYLGNDNDDSDIVIML